MQQLFLARLDGLDAPQVAAFLQGWFAALELMKQTDVVASDFDPQVRAAIADVVDRIEAAQKDVVDDDGS